MFFLAPTCDAAIVGNCIWPSQSGGYFGYHARTPCAAFSGTATKETTFTSRCQHVWVCNLTRFFAWVCWYRFLGVSGKWPCLQTINPLRGFQWHADRKPPTCSVPLNNSEQRTCPHSAFLWGKGTNRQGAKARVF